MTRPKAYDSQQGYRYQILCSNGRGWEHCDYAVDTVERAKLIAEYRMAYGGGWSFRAILLPKKYWAA